MSIFCFIYAAVLFFLLTPSVLLRLPAKGSKYVVAGVHSLVFGIVLFISHKLFRSFGLEGFTEGTTAAELPAGSIVIGDGSAAETTTAKPTTAKTTTKR